MNPHLPIYPKVLFPAKVILPEDAETVGPGNQGQPCSHCTEQRGQGQEGEYDGEAPSKSSETLGTFTPHFLMQDPGYKPIPGWPFFRYAYRWAEEGFKVRGTSICFMGMSTGVCVCVCVCPLGHSTATHDSDYKDKSRRANHAQMYVCTHKYPVFEIF